MNVSIHLSLQAFGWVFSPKFCCRTLHVPNNNAHIYMRCTARDQVAYVGWMGLAAGTGGGL